MNSESFAAQLQALVDFKEIDQLITRFGQTLDERDMIALRSIVTPDLVPVFTNGLRDMQARWEFTQHIITDRSIELHEGKCATVRANLIGSNIGPRPTGSSGDPYDAAGRAQFEVRGRYVWNLVRIQVGWRIAKTDLTYLWTTGAAS
jgi:hypothetical protein